MVKIWTVSGEVKHGGSTYHCRVNKGGPAFGVVEEGKDERNCRRPQQDDYELILELLEHQLPEWSGRVFR